MFYARLIHTFLRINCKKREAGTRGHVTGKGDAFPITCPICSKTTRHGQRVDGAVPYANYQNIIIHIRNSEAHKVGQLLFNLSAVSSFQRLATMTESNTKKGFSKLVTSHLGQADHSLKKTHFTLALLPLQVI